MVQFNTTILKFGQQGEKTGWTYVLVPAVLAQKLKPGNKKSFRVKGWLDDYSINGVALIPMGEGDFIMAINATMRKGIKKRHGASLKVQLEVDEKPVLPPPEFIECLKDEPKAFEHYNRLPKSHQHYFTRWIESAKTEQTKARRIAQSVSALSMGLKIGDAMKKIREHNRELLEK